MNIKKPIATIRLTLLANRAAPSPILGQALGQYGINIMEFCKLYNSKTSNIKDTIYIPTIVTIFSPTSFDIFIKTPTSTYLLKSVANISKGSSMTRRKQKNLSIDTEGFILLHEIYEMAKLKKSTRLLNFIRLKSLCKTLIGSAKSMGLNILSSAPSITKG